MLKWKKIGQIFNPTELKSSNWISEYAQLPNILCLDDKTVRVFISCRPQKNSDMQYISRTGYVDLDIENLSRIVNISNSPILELGNTGSFDEFGLMTSCVVPFKDKIYAYYTGWTRMQSVPYTMAIGMAYSNDNGNSFSKISQGPIIAQSIHSPYLASGPVVRNINGTWHMWFLRGTRWIEHNEKKEPIYEIAYATSLDGIKWDTTGHRVIEPVYENECQVSFGIFRHKEKWHSLFAYRQATDFRENKERSYRIGYAYSNDLIQWFRDDRKAGIDVSKTGWDSEMICYPHVAEIRGKIYLFYCGNNFGKEGFGIAVLEE